jgi:hypothetical protein
MKLSILLRKVNNRTANKAEYRDCKKRSDLLGFSLFANNIILSYLSANQLEDTYNQLHYQASDKLLKPLMSR